MYLYPEYTEITIMLAVKDCKPKVINLNFYYQSGIVPQNWNLAIAHPTTHLLQE